MKRKLCFVIQRYGLEVNGGAELHCRQLAEKMSAEHEVEVLTTKAVDYMTWRDEYTQDVEKINGVTVRRFSVERTREQAEFDEINARLMNGSLKASEEQEWLEKQGPYVPALIAYLRENRTEYDVFLFLSYLYYTTVMGVPEVKDRAIVLSLAHNEPFLQMKIYRQVFLTPRAFFFNTDEERILVREKFHNFHIPYKLGGVGVDVPEVVSGDAFRRKYHLNSYIVYVGRIDEGKNCGELFDFFARYKSLHPGDLKLVLMGKAVIRVPVRDDIVNLGFVDDEDKFNGIAGAEFLVLPSVFESLSMVVLEAFSLAKPVLVNGKCDVLRAHCDKCKGGFYYYGFRGFESRMLQLLHSDELRQEMGERGKRYVAENFRWSIIQRKLSDLIEYVVSLQNT